MKVNLFNPTNQIIAEHVNGTLIRVPAKGCALVTEKKAKVMMEIHQELTLGVAAEYSPADFERMKQLSSKQLVEFASVLMRGHQPPVPEPAAPADDTGEAEQSTEDPDGGQGAEPTEAGKGKKK